MAQSSGNRKPRKQTKQEVCFSPQTQSLELLLVITARQKYMSFCFYYLSGSFQCCLFIYRLWRSLFFDSLFSYFACFHLITSTFFYKVVSDDSLWSDPCEVLTQITFQFHLNVVGFVAAGTNSRDVFVVSAALKQLLFIQKWDDNWEWVQIVCSRACLWVFNVEIVFLKIQFTPIFFLFFSKHYFFFTSLLIFKPAVIIVLATGSTNKLLAQHLQFIKNTNHLQLLVCKFIRLIQQTTWR